MSKVAEAEAHRKDNCVVDFFFPSHQLGLLRLKPPMVSTDKVGWTLPFPVGGFQSYEDS